jgi:hypothetical protein
MGGIVAGKIGSLPVLAGAVSLSSGAVSQILSAGAGLVKSVALVGVGGLGLAMLLAGALMSNQKMMPAPNVPLNSSLVTVEVPRRRFLGIAMDDEIEFDCDNHQFKVPLGLLNTIYVAGKSVCIETVDGSFYSPVELKSTMTFLTSLGLQTVKPDQFRFEFIYNCSPKIQGVSVENIERLRDSLREALSYNLTKIIDIIGKDVFAQFFDISQIQQKLKP